MSKTISLQNQTGLPPWALTDLLVIGRQFHCHVNIRAGKLVIDGKKLLEVISLRRCDLSRVEVYLRGDDEQQALDQIVNSAVSRFIAKRQ